MCLLLIAHRVHPSYPLIVAGNRDEFHARPTLDADWWQDDTGILGGRDLEAGGSWLAISLNGRFAAVTNYRDRERPAGSKTSRGALIRDFLNSDADPTGWLESIDADAYGGFNLLVADDDRAGYLSNRGGGRRELEPGVYGVANATLDTPWPKVVRTRTAFEHALSKQTVEIPELLGILGDRRLADPEELTADNLPLEDTHPLSSPFVLAGEFGTRSSTVLLKQSDGSVLFTEERFDAAGEHTGLSEFRFRVEPNQAE